MHPYGVIGVGELPKKFRHLGRGQQLAVRRCEELEERAVTPQACPASPMPRCCRRRAWTSRTTWATSSRALIQQALDDAGGVVARAAERLRIRRTTLVEKMRKYGMSRRDEEGGE